MFCANCGKENLNDAKFCDGCGTPIVLEEENTNSNVENPNVVIESQEENKTIFILSYLGFLFFLPLVSCPYLKVGRFHANQGLSLLISTVIGYIALAIVRGILLSISFYLGYVISLLYFAWAIVLFALVIIGMMNANKGLQKPLPIIGKFVLIK